MNKLKINDLLLLDRDYPSLALFFQLKAQNVEFCVRMKGVGGKKLENLEKAKKHKK